MNASSGVRPVRPVPTKSQHGPPTQRASLQCSARDPLSHVTVDLAGDDAPGLLKLVRGLFVALILSLAAPGRADTPGSVLITGHDYDAPGGTVSTATTNNRVSIKFIMDPASNPFVQSGIKRFLFVESKIVPPAGHANGVNGIIASGFAPGIDFEHHDASTLDGELDLLGTKYSAIVVASDFGGVLTQAELDILNARAADIAAFLNAGGGLYAMGESNGGAGLTPNGGHFGFLPFVTSSPTSGENSTLTPFGEVLGLVEPNAPAAGFHNVFAGTAFGLQAVELDPDQRIVG